MLLFFYLVTFGSVDLIVIVVAIDAYINGYATSCTVSRSKTMN